LVPSTADANRPWSISTPLRSRCRAPVFGGDRLRAWYQALHHIRRDNDEMLHADGPGPPFGQDVIDGLDMRAEKFGARLTRCFENHGGRSLLAFVTAPCVRAAARTILRI
jgi:hypothetical protein